MSQSTAPTAPAAPTTTTPAILMLSRELAPTQTNVVSSIYNNPLKRNAALKEFLFFLDTIDYPCAVAVDGPWGSGKTFFIKAAQMCLEQMNPIITPQPDRQIFSRLEMNSMNHSFLPIYYDAWTNDNAYDPLLSLILTIANDEHINQQDYFEQNPSFKDKLEALASAFSGAAVGAAAGACVGGTVGELTGNPAAAAAGAEAGARIGSFFDSAFKFVKAVKKPEDPLRNARAEKTLEQEIREFLAACNAEVADRIVIFIDELDRCRPSFAVQLLERIKHYFHIDNVIFVLAVNSEQLVHTVRAFYGQTFDANRYLDRFFDFRVGLSPVDVIDYLNELQLQNANQTQQIYSYEIVSALTEQYRLSLREVEKLCRALKTAGGNPGTRNRFTGTGKDTKAFCYYVLLPLIYALKMTNLEHYNDFIAGWEPRPLLELFRIHDAESYISEFVVASNKLNNLDNLENAYREIFRSKECREIRNNLLNLVNLLSPFACYH